MGLGIGAIAEVAKQSLGGKPKGGKDISPSCPESLWRGPTRQTDGQLVGAGIKSQPLTRSGRRFNVCFKGAAFNDGAAAPRLHALLSYARLLQAGVCFSTQSPSGDKVLSSGNMWCSTSPLIIPCLPPPSQRTARC